MRKAVQNEIKPIKGDSRAFHVSRRQDHSQRIDNQTLCGDERSHAGLVIAYNGKPLTPINSSRDEEARLERFIKNPEELHKKREQERENAERTSRIIARSPDAFLYEDAGRRPDRKASAEPAIPLVKLNFRPNPPYQPPSRVEEVLTGMQGYVLVDAVHYRLASIDGTLFKVRSASAGEF